ncbi:hypothetical protein Tco_0686987 [Tanacetum coccineum]
MSRKVVFSDNEESLGEDASKQGRINADAEMFDVGTMTDDEAQALAALKSVKSKVKGNVTKEPNVPVNAVSALTKAKVYDKGKGKMIEPEHVKKMSKKDQLRSDKEEAKRLKTEFDEEERLAREKAEKEKEANIALIKEWDDIQAKIEADHELVQRLQAEEQEELSVEEKAKLFQQLLE